MDAHAAADDYTTRGRTSRPMTARVVGQFEVWLDDEAARNRRTHSLNSTPASPSRKSTDAHEDGSGGRMLSTILSHASPTQQPPSAASNITALVLSGGSHLGVHDMRVAYSAYACALKRSSLEATP